MNPGAGVAAVVNVVVNQQGMAAQRDATARGLQVGFGCHGILLIAERIAHVGDQLGQGDAQVRFAGSSPCRQKLTQSIEDHGAEGAVILGQVVDGRRRRQIRWTVRSRRRAVEEGRTFDLEGEFNFGQLRIESGERLGDLEGILLRLR